MKLRYLQFLIFVMILLPIQVFASNHNLQLLNRVLTSEDSIQDIEDLEEDYYIIDVNEYPISAEINQKLEKTTKVLNYIPYTFFVVKADKNEIKKLKQENILKRIWKYTSESNYDPQLEDSQNENINIQIILFDSSDLNEVLNKLSNLGTIVYSKDNLIIMNINPSNIQEISNTKGVEFITLLQEATITNDLTNIVTGNSNFRTFWNLFGNNQIIAIGDTGIDTGINNPSMHDDFEGRINNIINWAAVHGIGFYLLTCPPICSTNSADTSGHGTHTSGSALGDGNKSGSNPSLNIYTNSYAGAAPKSNLVFLDIGEDNPNSNTLYPGSMSEYFEEAFLNNAKISSNSWNFQGSSFFTLYTSESFFTDIYTYSNKDFVVVFSAGNTGPSTINPPATAKNVIAVGGNNKNNINSMYPLTATGPTADGRIKPDIIAPAMNTISTRSSANGNSNGCASNGINQFYSTCSGTSMATPVIAGLSALAREYFIKVKGIQPLSPLTPSSALIKASLINGAEDMGYGIPSFTAGWGRANISNSFPSYGITIPTLNTPVKEIFFLDNPFTFTATGQTYSFTVHPYLNTKLKATLVWTDRAGSFMSAQNLPKLMNDLDFKLTDPSGNIYNGNDFTAPYNDQFDHLNNVEQIRISNTLSGPYTFTVTAYNVPSATFNQKFAVFINYEILPPSITMQGIPSANNLVTFTLSDQNHPNIPFLSYMSLGSSPGIPLSDGRIVPANGDILFFLSLFLAPVLGLSNSQSTTNNNGQAIIQWLIPSFIPPGLPITAGAVLTNPNVGIPYSIKAISPAFQFTTQ